MQGSFVATRLLMVFSVVSGMLDRRDKFNTAKDEKLKNTCLGKRCCLWSLFLFDSILRGGYPKFYISAVLTE